MAKVAFSKLKCKPENEEKIIIFNEEEIVIKQYLPIQEKLHLIGDVAQWAHEEDYGYSNPVKADVMLKLLIVFAYTNITFTEKQKVDLPKLYDLLVSSGLLSSILQAIPEAELNELTNGVARSIAAIYEYQNSIAGILENLRTSYNDADISVEQLKNDVEALQNNSFLSQVLPLMDLND